MFRDNLKEQKNFFMWYYSKKKDDYVCPLGVHHWCDMPCDQDHPYYWSNVPFYYLNNIECKKDEEAIGAFGCSITFGVLLKEKETWPSLLSTKIKKMF